MKIPPYEMKTKTLFNYHGSKGHSSHSMKALLFGGFVKGDLSFMYIPLNEKRC